MQILKLGPKGEGATKERLLNTLKIIEYIACEEGFDRTSFIRDDNDEVKEIKSDKVIDLIYRLAHAGVNECGNPHLTWQKELDELINQFI